LDRGIAGQCSRLWGQPKEKKKEIFIAMPFEEEEGRDRFDRLDAGSQSKDLPEERKKKEKKKPFLFISLGIKEKRERRGLSLDSFIFFDAGRVKREGRWYRHTP